MKKTMIVLCALALVATIVQAAQKDVSLQDIASPRLLEGVLDNNFDELYQTATNIPASSITRGNIDKSRITNAVSELDGTTPIAKAAISNALASPSAIGGTTPAAGSFTTIGGTVITLSRTPVFNLAGSAAATNDTPTKSLQITMQGTNYLIKLYPN